MAQRLLFHPFQPTHNTLTSSPRSSHIIFTCIRNFINPQKLTTLLHSHVPDIKIPHILAIQRRPSVRSDSVLFCLVYQGVLGPFPTITDHFTRLPKIPEKSKNLRLFFVVIFTCEEIFFYSVTDTKFFSDRNPCNSL